MMIEAIYPDWKTPSHIKAIQTVKKTGDISVFKKKIDSNFTFLNQTHGVNIVELPNNSPLEADASFTYAEQTICAVRTADCLPILMTDISGSFVAAIHAGWRSLSNGIIEETLKKLKTKTEFIVWLGPCISQKNYEVGRDVYHQFIKMDPSVSCAFQKHYEKYKLSLVKAAKIKLTNLRIKNIFGNSFTQDFCTFDDQTNFFSYRRSNDSGRMVSLIWIED